MSLRQELDSGPCSRERVILAGRGDEKMAPERFVQEA